MKDNKDIAYEAVRDAFLSKCKQDIDSAIASGVNHAMPMDNEILESIENVLANALPSKEDILQTLHNAVYQAITDTLKNGVKSA